MKQTRRNFISKAALGIPFASLPLSLNNQINSKQNIFSLQKGDVILFQGDSITDSYREKNLELPNNPLSFGEGYAFIAASELLYNNSEKNFQIYNRGISGNKVPQLYERWEKDCINLKPTIVSIMIGINDFWHLKDKIYDGSLEEFEKGYRELLTITKNKLPNVKLIICEPFILLGTKIKKDWPDEFSKYQRVAKNLSAEFNATWVPFQDSFDKALEEAPASYWAPDGVHPSMAGSKLMAKIWLEKFNSI